MIRVSPAAPELSCGRTKVLVIGALAGSSDVLVVHAHYSHVVLCQGRPYIAFVGRKMVRFAGQDRCPLNTRLGVYPSYFRIFPLFDE